MFDYSGDDTVREFSSCAFNPSGETAVFGTYNRFYIFTLNAKRTWEEVGAEPPGGGGGGRADGEWGQRLSCRADGQWGAALRGGSEGQGLGGDVGPSGLKHGLE